MRFNGVLTRAARLPGFRRIWAKLALGSVQLRVRYGIGSRPNYSWGVYHAADQAKRLGCEGLSVIEFGVAGGDGLIALEHIATEIGQHFGVPISVYGFDTGEGMPAPVDFRDLPHVWGRGFYPMNESKLRSRLIGAELVLGDVSATVPELLTRPALHPIGFIAFDLDYYSSTKAAFKIFDGTPRTRLPRVLCYFDDIIWPEIACHSEYAGELAAIRDFNESGAVGKLAPWHLLRHMVPLPAAWHDQMYVFHDFAHPLYCKNITPQEDRHRELPLT